MTRVVEILKNARAQIKALGSRTDPINEVHLAELDAAIFEAGKVWVVLFLDGFGCVAWVSVLSWSKTGKQVDEWASSELRRHRAAFPESSLAGNRSLPMRFVSYGCDIQDVK